MSKYLYVDSEGRVCRIDESTGAMIPVEWNQPDVDAARKRYELAKAEIAKITPFNRIALGPIGPTGNPGPDSVTLVDGIAPVAT